MLRDVIISSIMREKYRELYTRLMASARDAGLKILCNEVEDSIQDAFLLLYEKWDYCKDRNLSGWLYITAMNNLNNRMRIIKAREKTSVTNLDDDNGIADKAADRIVDDLFYQIGDLEDREDMLQRIRQCITQDDYEFLVDYYDDESTAKQLAKKYNTTQAVVWKRRQRLVDKIRQTIIRTMFTLIMSGLILPVTLTSEGGVNGDDEARKTAYAPNYKGSDSGKPFLSKRGARVVLAFLQHMPADQFGAKDLRLADICYGVIDDKFGQDKPDVEGAVRVFKGNVVDLKSAKRTEERRSKRISKRALVALVVVGCLLAAAACYALGWLPWLFSMTQDSEQYTVGITTGDKELEWENMSFMPTGLSDEFDAILKEHDMNLPLPTWLPEGVVYQLSDIVSDDSTSTRIKGSFGDDTQTTVIILISKYHNPEIASEMFLEKDSIVYKELDHNGIKYIVYSNRKWMNAFSYTPPYNCTISVRSSSTDTIIKMIESIPERS